MDLSWLGDQAAIKTFIAGKVRPPPRPSRTLMAMRAPYPPRVAQTGLSTVPTMFMATAMKKTHLPL